MQSQFERSFNLADIFCKAMNRPMFVSFLEADNTGKDVKSLLAKWAGNIDLESKASIYGPWKLFSLLAAGSQNGQVITTPINAQTYGCPFEGGVRQEDLMCSVSKYSNTQIDAMFALLLFWSLTYEVRLHHVGFKYTNDERRELAMQEFMKTHKSLPILLPASDHDRYYFRVDDHKAPNKKYWMEFQSWPMQLGHDGIHIDVATNNCIGLLRFIEKNTKLAAIYWDYEKNSPQGMVSAMEGNVEISIMVRDTWAPPEDW